MTILGLNEGTLPSVEHRARDLTYRKPHIWLRDGVWYWHHHYRLRHALSVRQLQG